MYFTVFCWGRAFCQNKKILVRNALSLHLIHWKIVRKLHISGQKSIRNLCRKCKKNTIISGLIFALFWGPFWEVFWGYVGGFAGPKSVKKGTKMVMPYQVGSWKGLGRHFGPSWKAFWGSLGPCCGHFGVLGRRFGGSGSHWEPFWGSWQAFLRPRTQFWGAWGVF